MTAIVLNTAKAAVTEYDWTFQSMTEDMAVSASGLFALGGSTDAGVDITGELRSGKPGGDIMQSVGAVFVAGSSNGDGVLIVEGRDDEWEYAIAARTSGVGRATPGRGISESYLAFGYRNAEGADFRIDRIDAEIFPSKNRRKA